MLRFVTDTTPAILAVIFLFVCPRENIFKGRSYRNLIDWKDLQTSFPWNIIFLIGGALVMATGFEVMSFILIFLYANGFGLKFI